MCGSLAYLIGVMVDDCLLCDAYTASKMGIVLCS